MTDWHFGYQFNTPIVGESNYKKALQQCYDSPDGYRKGQSVFVDVNLVYETSNPYDENAVAVISVYGKLGYLSKQDAIRYLHLCDGNRDTLSVRCKIYSGSKDLYGAWVDLDLEDLPSSNQSIKKYKDIANTDNKPQPITSSREDTSQKKVSSGTVIAAIVVLGLILFAIF